MAYKLPAVGLVALIASFGGNLASIGRTPYAFIETLHGEEIENPYGDSRGFGDIDPLSLKFYGFHCSPNELLDAFDKSPGGNLYLNVSEGMAGNLAQVDYSASIPKRFTCVLTLTPR
jgi:hypothetical protein